MSEHALLSPSSASQWMNCPASVRLQQQYPETGEKSAADEGTAAHAAIMVRLTTGQWPAGMDDDMRDDCQVFVSLIEAENADTRVSVESRVAAPSIHPHLWGTCDAYAIDISKTTVRVYDFKYGWGIVEAVDNFQLLCYALAITDTCSIGGDWSYELNIIQPRPYHVSGAVRKWRVTGERLRDYAVHIRASAQDAAGNDPSAVAGRHCKYCSARHVCTALRMEGLDALEQAYSSTPVDLPPAALGLELQILMRAQEMLEARITGLQAEAMVGIQRGAQVPGWTINHQPGRLDWIKPAEEVIALGEAMGLQLARKPDVITPSQAKKAGLPADIVAAFAERKPGAAKLVPADTTQARAAFGG